jgi:hypothetical protein
LAPDVIGRIVSEALHAHGIPGVPQVRKWTMKAAAGLLVLQGLDTEEVGRRLGVSGRRIEDYCQRWRKDNNITNDAYRAQIAANLAARRGGTGSWRSEPPVEGPLAPLELPPTQTAASRYNPTAAEVDEVMSFVNDVGLATVLNELHAQGKTHFTRADVERMPESLRSSLMSAASIREMTAKTYGKGWR